MIFKNKTGKSVPRHFKFRLMTYPHSYINFAWDIVETASDVGILEQRGHYWYYQGENIANGRLAMEQLILADGEIAQSLESDLVEYITSERKAKSNDSEPEPESIEELNPESFPSDSDDQQFQDSTP